MAVTNLVSGAPQGEKRGFRRFWLTLRQLFHEAVGGVFAVLALAWLQSALRAWTRDVSRWLVFAAVGMTVLLAVFAWTSFRRARQLR
jgi:hypothetical protein